MIATAAAVVASLALQQCPARTVGPGTHIEGGTRGATCLLSAFRRCRPAEYVLTGLAGGTVAIVNFSVQHWDGGCAVLVTRSIGSGQIHDTPVVTGPRVCRRLRPALRGVVADRCSRGKPAVIPLTSFA